MLFSKEPDRQSFKVINKYKLYPGEVSSAMTFARLKSFVTSMINTFKKMIYSYHLHQRAQNGRETQFEN